MPVCSYVVFPRTGRSATLARTLRGLDGCEVEAAENREILLLVTTAETPEADRALRARVESEPDIECMVMAFGEIDPETEEGDPVRAAKAAGAGRGLPVLPAGSRRDPASGSSGAADVTGEES